MLVLELGTEVLNISYTTFVLKWLNRTTQMWILLCLIFLRKKSIFPSLIFASVTINNQLTRAFSRRLAVCASAWSNAYDALKSLFLEAIQIVLSCYFMSFCLFIIVWSIFCRHLILRSRFQLCTVYKFVLIIASVLTPCYTHGRPYMHTTNWMLPLCLTHFVTFHELKATVVTY